MCKNSESAELDSAIKIHLNFLLCRDNDHNAFSSTLKVIYTGIRFLLNRFSFT